MSTNYKEMGDHQKYHQTLEFITKSLSVESPSGDTRVCPFCLQNTCVDQLSEHVAYCMSIWNSLFSNDSDLLVEENQSENSEKKRKLFSLDAADAMSLNPTKKNYQNKMRPHPLLEELGDDMIRHFLSFMENKFLIGVCMRVSKHWLEIIRTIPIEFTLDIKEQLSSVLQIVSNPSGLCLTKLELPFEYSNLCCIPMTNNKNLDRLQTFILHELQSKYFVNSLIESSYMGNLRELTLKHCQHFGNDILAALCTSTYLQSLTSLTIESGNITADGLSVLKSNPPIMRNLTTLGLNFNPCRDRGASFIANCSSLSNLRRLCLDGVEMKDEGAISISTSPYFLNVTELHLCYNALTDAAITAICESRQLTNIQTLKLGCSLSHTKNVVSVLSSSQNMKNLKALNISNVDIYNIDDLAQSDIMNNLTEIDLSDCAMNDEDVVSISKSVVMKNLRTLVLDFNVITYHGVHSLSTSPNLINLTKLHLANNSLGDDGAKAIAGGFSMLTYLDLSGCDIGNEGLKSISNSTTLTKLRTLNLNFSKVIQEWKVIGNSSNLSKLNRLYLANNDTLTIRNVVSILKHMKRLVELNVQRCNSPFSDETMQVLCEMFPACDLSW